MTRLHRTLRALAATALSLSCLVVAGSALADEAAIRKAFAARAEKDKFPAVDEVLKTPIAGLYEVRMGSEILYTDDKGEYVIFPDQGHLIDMKSRTDLTEARLNKINAIELAALQVKDAIVIKQGTGARKLAVFEDPNCGYCRKLEADLKQVKDVTIHVYLMPILGPDSVVKARDIWCARDNAKVWRNWMVDGLASTRQMGTCDTSALTRNTELGRKHRIQGTPALVFEDGSRTGGAIPLDQIETRLAAAAKKG